MKLYIYICNPESFLQADYGLSLNISSYKPDYAEDVFENWIYAGEVDVEIDINEKEIRQCATKALDKQLQRVRAESQIRVDRLETRKANLIALPNIPVSAA